MSFLVKHFPTKLFHFVNMKLSRVFYVNYFFCFFLKPLEVFWWQCFHFLDMKFATFTLLNFFLINFLFSGIIRFLLHRHEIWWTWAFFFTSSTWNSWYLFQFVNQNLLEFSDQTSSSYWIGVLYEFSNSTFSTVWAWTLLQFSI